MNGESMNTEYVDPDGRPKLGNAKCSYFHPLWLVAEGYGYCRGMSYRFDIGFWAWRLSEPAPDSGWRPTVLKDGSPAWVSYGRSSLNEVLEFIQNDMKHGGQSVLAEGPTYADWLATVS